MRQYVRSILLLASVAATVLLIIVLALHVVFTADRVERKLRETLQTEYGIILSPQSRLSLQYLPHAIIHVPAGTLSLTDEPAISARYQSITLELDALALFAKTPTVRKLELNGLDLILPEKTSWQAYIAWIETWQPYPIDQLVVANASVSNAQGKPILSAVQLQSKREKFTHFRATLEAALPEGALHVNTRFDWPDDTRATQLQFHDTTIGFNDKHETPWQANVHIENIHHLFAQGMPNVSGLSAKIENALGTLDVSARTLTQESEHYTLRELILNATLNADEYPLQFTGESEATLDLTHGQLALSALALNVTHRHTKAALGYLRGSLSATPSTPAGSLMLDGNVAGVGVSTALNISPSSVAGKRAHIDGRLLLEQVPKLSSITRKALLNAISHLEGRITLRLDEPNATQLQHVQATLHIADETLYTENLELALHGGSLTGNIALKASGRWQAKLSGDTQALPSPLPIDGAANIQLDATGELLEADALHWQASSQLGAGCLLGGDVDAAVRLATTTHQTEPPSELFTPTARACYQAGRLVMEGTAKHWDIPVFKLFAERWSLDSFGSVKSESATPTLLLRGTFTSRSTYAYDPVLRLAVGIRRVAEGPVFWDPNWQDFAWQGASSTGQVHRTGTEALLAGDFSALTTGAQRYVQEQRSTLEQGIDSLVQWFKQKQDQAQRFLEDVLAWFQGLI